MNYQIGTKVFEDWEIISELGEGGYGKVYELRKNEYGIITGSALKVMKIPKSETDIKTVLSEGMDEQSVEGMFQEIVDDLAKEIAVMSSLKSHPNIVRYEDHKVLKNSNKINWDILIRMELLCPLNQYTANNSITEKDVIKLGIDIGNAIAFCEKKGLIHRDVKPENIFVDELKNFKLGDFGIARTVEKTNGGLSRKGTELYMAPEVYIGKSYDSTVDIYSLGLVLYKLLNDGRLPFYPLDKKSLSFKDREYAVSRRINGEKIHPPRNASPELIPIILKACEYDPSQRYLDASSLVRDLKKLISEDDNKDNHDDSLNTSVENSNNDDNNVSGNNSNKPYTHTTPIFRTTGLNWDYKSDNTNSDSFDDTSDTDSIGYYNRKEKVKQEDANVEVKYTDTPIVEINRTKTNKEKTQSRPYVKESNKNKKRNNIKTNNIKTENANYDPWVISKKGFGINVCRIYAILSMIGVISGCFIKMDRDILPIYSLLQTGPAVVIILSLDIMALFPLKAKIVVTLEGLGIVSGTLMLIPLFFSIVESNKYFLAGYILCLSIYATSYFTIVSLQNEYLRGQSTKGNKNDRSKAWFFSTISIVGEIIAYYCNANALSISGKTDAFSLFVSSLQSLPVVIIIILIDALAFMDISNKVIKVFEGLCIVIGMFAFLAYGFLMFGDDFITMGFHLMLGMFLFIMSFGVFKWLEIFKKKN